MTDIRIVGGTQDHPIYEGIEIAAGKAPHPGWVNLDHYQMPGITHLGDASKIDFPDESFTYARASHILEHFPYTETISVLQEWKRILVRGGTIEVIVPNLYGVISQWADGGMQLGTGHPDNGLPEAKWEKLLAWIYGDQTQPNPGMVHKAGFHPRSLKARIEGAGFVDVRLHDIPLTDIQAIAWGRKP